VKRGVICRNGREDGGERFRLNGERRGPNLDLGVYNAPQGNLNGKKNRTQRIRREENVTTRRRKNVKNGKKTLLKDEEKKAKQETSQGEKS